MRLHSELFHKTAFSENFTQARNTKMSIYTYKQYLGQMAAGLCLRGDDDGSFVELRLNFVYPKSLSLKMFQFSFSLSSFAPEADVIYKS